jgi:drug/metabolite transporter (DMT)-like permease
LIARENAFVSLVWMLGSVISFCLLAVATRELNKQIPVQEIIVFRSLLGLIVTTIIITYLRQFDVFKTRRIGLQLVRHGFHFFGQAGWLFGIGYLTLADVFALEFTVPVWVAIIAALFLRERLTPMKIVAIALGLTGVVIIVNPTTGLLEPAALIVLGAAVCYAVAHTSNKSLSGTETALGLLFYMSLIQLPIGLTLSIGSFVMPGGVEWLWLATIGLMALTGHFCLTRAMQVAEVGYVMTIDFLRLPLIALIGVALYLEPLKLSLMIGGLVILAANLVNLKDQLSRIHR